VSEPSTGNRLRAAVDQLRPGDDKPPAEVVEGWDDFVRIALHDWVDALDRDLRRAAAALEAVAETEGTPPSDDQVAALEECLWRLAAATEKLDAIASLAFGGRPFVVLADKPAELDMRPSRDRNKASQRSARSRRASSSKRARTSRGSVHGSGAIS
jgi:hypothetical protein